MQSSVDTPPVDAALDTAAWHDFGLGVAGASAALAGLLVVAVSINVGRILAARGLVERAAATLVLLSTPLIVSLILLAPDLPQAVAGGALAAIGLLAGTALAWLHRVRAPQRSRVQWFLTPVLPAFFMAVPTALAGLGVLTGAGGGLHWLLVAVIAAFLGGLDQAWVLLIEILR